MSHGPGRAASAISPDQSPRMAAGYLCSYQKSGRTWIRFILAQLLNDKYRLEQDLNLVNMFSLVPKLEAENPASEWKREFLFAEQQVPLILSAHLPWRQIFADKPTVLLLRNPADTLVSFYYHKTRAQQVFSGTIEQFIVDPRFGLTALIAYLRSWVDHLDDPLLLVLTYEHFRRDPVQQLARLTSHYGLDCSPGQHQQALAASTVERMRALEAQFGVGNPHSFSTTDPEARRVRRAQVGQFQTVLSAELVNEIERGIKQAGLEEMLSRFDILPRQVSVSDN